MYKLIMILSDIVDNTSTFFELWKMYVFGIFMICHHQRLFNLQTIFWQSSFDLNFSFLPSNFCSTLFVSILLVIIRDGELFLSECSFNDVIFILITRTINNPEIYVEINKVFDFIRKSENVVHLLLYITTLTFDIEQDFIT